MSRDRRTLAWLLLAGFCCGASSAAENTEWFVSFERVQVSPVERLDTTRLVDAGTIDTDGFTELVFSLGGEFKEGIPESGTVGAILIPDIDVFTHLFLNEGEFVFPLEVKHPIRSGSSAIFVSDQQRAKVAFPRYRVYLYNDSSSGAMVSLFVYRTRGEERVMRIAGLFLLVLLATPLEASVTVTLDESVDFTAYSTYAWKPGTDAARPQVQAWVVGAVERELKAAGLRVVGRRQPDLHVVTHAFAEMDAQLVGTYVHADVYDVGIIKSDTVLTTKGVLVVELIDRATGKRVWRGMAQEVMGDPKPAKVHKKIDSVTKKMFKKYPRK